MAKVLVVEDCSDTRDALSKYLTAAGHHVICVNDGREALAEVLHNLPDVVLLDLILPEMDGPSFLEVVRSYLRLQSLPVVILTGNPDSPMVDRTRTLKVNAILAQGKATSEDIKAAIERAVVTLPG
jgi:CheY-like chemotaxis protein